MSKWIENKSDYSYNLCVREAKTGLVLVDKILPVAVIADGNILQSGIVAVNDDEYKTLSEKCKTFINGVKRGLFIVHDELPASAVTPAEMLKAALAENAKLREELAKSKKSSKKEE